MPECECLEGDKCHGCSSPNGYEFVQTLSDALGKLEQLNSQIVSLRASLNKQNIRISDLENDSEGSENELRNSSRKRSSWKKHKKNTSKSKNRIVQVEESVGSSISIVSDSEDLLGLNVSSRIPSIHSNIEVAKSAQRSKTKKLRRPQCEKSVSASTMSETSDSSDSSGMNSRRRRKRVKSGAEVKMRPVIKTEVWPHTIANEDDGEDTTSEDINLSKFLSCFTYLMITCVESEAAGRAVLLHAISLVLECLPWKEARIFHNLTMVKIEQGRLNWGSDFITLANEFLDKKVRMTLRSRSQANLKPFNKRNSSYDSKNCAYKNNSSLSVICRLWNSGFCSFGASCKRWHVCLSCAEGGKLGEPHQASTHIGSSTSINEPNQYF